MTKLIPVNLELSYLVDGDRYMAEVDGDCKTGIFSTTAGNRYFRADDGKVYTLRMIQQLWKIQNTPSILEIIKSSDPLQYGKIDLIPQSEPSGFYYIKYGECYHPYRLLLYFVMSNALLEQLIGSKIKYYGMCDDWGKPFNSDYRYDVVEYTVIKDDIKDALNYLERMVAKRRDEINNYLLLRPVPKPSYPSAEFGTTLHNPVMPDYLPCDVKPISHPLPMIDIHTAIKHDTKSFGSILNGCGYFEINSHSEHPSIGRTISIYLPTDNNKYLATDLQNPDNIVMGRCLDQVWGSMETIPTFESGEINSKVFRVAKTSYYGTPDTIDSMALQCTRNTEKNILNKSIKMSIQILLIDKGVKFGSILDNSCFFRIEPYRFISTMDYRYPTGPTIDLLVGKNITLYLPTDDNQFHIFHDDLKYSLRSKNKILLGNNLNPKWGMPRPLCVKESSSFPSKVYRARDIAFFDMPDVIDASITEYLCSIEQFLRSAEPKRQVTFTF